MYPIVSFQIVKQFIEDMLGKSVLVTRPVAKHSDAYPGLQHGRLLRLSPSASELMSSHWWRRRGLVTPCSVNDFQHKAKGSATINGCSGMVRLRGGLYFVGLLCRQVKGHRQLQGFGAGVAEDPTVLKSQTPHILTLPQHRLLSTGPRDEQLV